MNARTATVLRAALADGEDTLIARIVIDKAKAGDAGAARFLLGLLCPRLRGRAITLAMPKRARAGDVVAVFNATLRAMASGEITPDEALTITRVLDGRTRMLNAWQLERQMRRREVIPGDEVFAADDEAAAVTLTEPSPLGRGQGEGARPTRDGAGFGSAKFPHPGPLPEGEGEAERGAPPANYLHPHDTPHLPIADEAMGPPEHLPKGLSRKGRENEGAAAPTSHLHSACIQPSPATVAGRRDAVAWAMGEVLRDMR